MHVSRRLTLTVMADLISTPDACTGLLTISVTNILPIMCCADPGATINFQSSGCSAEQLELPVRLLRDGEPPAIEVVVALLEAMPAGGGLDPEPDHVGV